MLSIVIPVYNELSRINRLKQVYNYCKKQVSSFEIIVVDDGSTDNTLKQVNKIIKESNKKIAVIHYKINKGKGYAVKKGVQKAKGNNILFMDTDLSTPLEEIPKFLKLIEKYDLVIGSRELPESKVSSRKHKRLSGKIGNILIKTVLGIKINDTQCGFKMFNKVAAKRLFSKQTIDRWGFDFELLYLAKKFNMKVKEQPIKWKEDTESKVKWYDYFTTLTDLAKIRFNSIKKVYD